MGIIRWLFDADVRHYEQKLDRAMRNAEHAAGRVIQEAERAAKGVVEDAQHTAEQAAEHAQRRIIRAYVIAFCVVVGAGLIHFVLVRSQVRALHATIEEAPDPTEMDVGTGGKRAVSCRQSTGAGAGRLVAKEGAPSPATSSQDRTVRRPELTNDRNEEEQGR